MKEEGEERVLRATECSRCHGNLNQRILSVYDHRVICMDCKRKEEERPDYGEVSKDMIRQCLVDTEREYGDPGDFCYHHFYPYPSR
jgi:recombinational DNA repair protein (RecF pathway)